MWKTAEQGRKHSGTVHFLQFPQMSPALPVFRRNRREQQQQRPEAEGSAAQASRKQTMPPIRSTPPPLLPQRQTNSPVSAPQSLARHLPALLCALYRTQGNVEDDSTPTSHNPDTKNHRKPSYSSRRDS
ncbi:hypothetical protein SKAU_G00015390 [Synaphobranchus kaupii]|uniref:Uncharacterized protein n=1 Tax=Synaphobranchus kaupii TaxID=118154 RepID=A0A9Q1GAS6_SYNKA|nr:hypothetical protein SKAU_G00015390 [Synaphobranchus kaupii]